MRQMPHTVLLCLPLVFIRYMSVCAAHRKLHFSASTLLPATNAYPVSVSACLAATAPPTPPFLRRGFEAADFQFLAKHFKLCRLLAKRKREGREGTAFSQAVRHRNCMTAPARFFAEIWKLRTFVFGKAFQTLWSAYRTLVRKT